MEAIRRWQGHLKKISQQLNGPNAQRNVALTNLARISDSDAIPAIEYLLCGDEATAVPAIAVFSRMPGHEATVALAKQAVCARWGKIRRQAAEALKNRPFEDFVPGLVGTLASAYTSTRSDGGLAYFYWGRDSGTGEFETGVYVLLRSYLIARETDDQFQVGVLQTTDYRISHWLRGLLVTATIDSFNDAGIIPNVSTGTPDGPTDIRAEMTLRQLLLTREHAEHEYEVDKRVDDLNDRTHELNRRIIDVLAVVSGLEFTSDLKTWWQWWANYVDTQRVGDKPVAVAVSENIIGDPTTRFSVPTSCFAAGTPVWTESGAKLIETVQVGDRVLAKDIETGELAYKPVLRTTIRPPKELTTLRFGDETIVCTGGHRFWSSGSGWIKARDLEPHTQLHTVTGNTPVWSAKKGSTAETYNLVVADFHTYFVGKTGVLCQDLLIPHSTNNVVPGLSRGQAVARK
jgi:hypothetical protein